MSTGDPCQFCGVGNPCKMHMAPFDHSPDFESEEVVRLKAEVEWLTEENREQKVALEDGTREAIGRYLHAALDITKADHEKITRLERELREAGFTYTPGAERWRPPVNKEMGDLWRRLFACEDWLKKIADQSCDTHPLDHTPCACASCNARTAVRELCEKAAPKQLHESNQRESPSR